MAAAIPFYSIFELISVSQAVHRGGNAAAAGDEVAVVAGVDRHDGGGAEEAAEVDQVADLFAGGGDDADGCCFAVDDADGGFVGDDGGNGLPWGVAGNGDHIEADGTDAGHRFKLFDGQ